MRPSKPVSVALVCCLLNSCSRIYDFYGLVIDGDGRPISGATFHINPHDWPEPGWCNPADASGRDGRFEASWGSAVGVELFRFVTTCDGYQPDRRLVLADSDEGIRVVLARDAQGGPKLASDIAE